MSSPSFAVYVDQQVSALQNHSGPVSICDHKGCANELGDYPDHCEWCDRKFCGDGGHLKQSDGMPICAACIEKQQPIIHQRCEYLAILIQRARAAKYLTEDELIEAVKAWCAE